MKQKINFWFLLFPIILTVIFISLFLIVDINIFEDTLTSLGFFSWNVFLHNILAIMIVIAMISYSIVWGIIFKRIRRYLLSAYSFLIIIPIIIFIITLEPILEWIIVFMGILLLYFNSFFF